jgi:hypothetical protein
MVLLYADCEELLNKVRGLGSCRSDGAGPQILQAPAAVCHADTACSHSLGIRAISMAAAAEELGAELEMTVPASLRNWC